MFAITGGKVITMAGRVFEPGVVLFNEGKIVAVEGVAGPLEGMSVYDASGKYVLPGFIDAHCHVGMIEEVFRDEGDDANECTGPVSPHLRAIDAVYPGDLGFGDALSGGVTTVVTGPGSANVLGGEMIAIKTAGTVADEMTVRFPAGVKAALGENPKRVYGNQKKAPATRMANAALLREALAGAKDYMIKRQAAIENPGKFCPVDLKMEALARVLTGEVPLRIHAHRSDDIMTAVRIGREYGIRIIIEHCTEGYKVAKQLAKEGIKAVLGPLIVNRAKPELYGINLANPSIMCQEGIEFAIMTDHPVVPIQYLTISAALAVKGGLSEERALGAITINAARICGIDARVGSLEPGKDADIVIIDGHPLDIRSKVEKVFVNGIPAFPKI